MMGETSPSTTVSISMLAFVGSVFVGRRWVQLAGKSRSINSKSKSNSPLPPSLKESYSLCTDEVESLRTKHMSKSNSVSYKNTGPLHIVNGYKARLVDVNGVEYLDTRNNVAHVGHGHPEVVRAITWQTEQLNTNTRYLHQNASLLAKKLADLLPCELDVVFFVNSGSEANDLALRLARAYHKHQSRECSVDDESTQQNKHVRTDHVITIDHAYHGHTLATIDVSPYKHRQGTEVKDCPYYVHRAPCPDVYRGEYKVNNKKPQNIANKDSTGGEEEGQQYCKSEIEAGEKYAAYVEQACEEITSQGHSVSAFLMEGGMSVAGVILPPKSYIRRCIDAVHKAGGVYIADEVQTGFGRLGKCMWAFQYSNDDTGDQSNLSDDIVPDIVTVGKPFGNGMPLAAVITTPRIAAAFESTGVEYFNTFAGSPVCCAAGLSMLDILSYEKLQENATNVGNYMIQLFSELQSRSDWIGDIRGSGLFIGVELVRDPSTLEPATEETSFVCSILKEKYKVLTSIDGANENVIVVKPPMVFSREDADLFVSCFEKALCEDLPCAKLEELGKTPT